jgi:hypothetical protein
MRCGESGGQRLYRSTGSGQTFGNYSQRHRYSFAYPAGYRLASHDRIQYDAMS